jgi:hypothetical protein
LVPFGALTVTTPGTTIPLSTNCGPLAGQVGNPTSYTNPPVPGTPLRQITLTNSNATPGNAVALLPRGSTFTGNPGNVIAYIPGGATITIPQGQPFENGILPENFVLDIAAGTGPIVVYGCGVIS